MYGKFYSPNIIATGSSEIDQSSYSHHADNDVGVAVIDRYTYYNLDFLETQVRDPSSKKTLGDLFDSYDEAQIHSHPGIRWDLVQGGEQVGKERLIMDFFGNVQNVEVENGTKAGDTELQEDLLALGRKIAELRERAEAAEQNATTKPLVEHSTSRKLRAAKVESDEHSWSKRAIGLSALSAVSLAWWAGMYMESA